MKKSMRHTETLVKRHLVNFLTLTFMLVLIVPPAYASHSPKKLKVSPKNLRVKNKTNERHDILISPSDGDKIPPSGGSKYWPWVYRMFGSNETQDQMIAVRTDRPGGVGPFKPESYRWFGSKETNKTEPILISPVDVPPPDRSKYWPWVYRMFGSNDTNDHLFVEKQDVLKGDDGTIKPKPFLISPTDKDRRPPASGSKSWPWAYRMFGSNETRDQMIAVGTNRPGGAGPFKPESNRWLGSKETNKTEPILISPCGDESKPGDSGGFKKWPWAYRMFG